MNPITPLLLLAASQSHAGDTVPADSLPTIRDLDEFVVTGTRTPKLLAETPVQTRLITADEIGKSGAADIQELLTAVLPGVEFSYAMNQQVNMNLAGFSGQSVLILLDGERLAGETMENTDFSRLNMDNVERVEVVKGAASALYGSNAAGGVINIITRRQKKRWNASVSGRVAGHGEYRAALNTGFSAGRWSNNLDISHSGSDTYTVCLDLADRCDFRKVYGGKTLNINDRLSWQLSEKLRLSARGGYYFRQRLYNPDTPDRYRDFSAGIRAEYTISDAGNLEIAYAFDQYDKSDFMRDAGLDIRDYSNSQHTLHLLYNHTFSPRHTLTAGADGMRDYLMSYQFAGSGHHRQLTADIFAQYDWTIDRRWEVVAAARWDYFSDGRQSQATAKVSGRYRATALPLTIRAGYAGGFRAPTLKEKYMDFDMSGIFDIHGNPSLKPEKSHNLNISAEYTRSPFNITAGGSYNFIGNKITTSPVSYTQQGDPYIRYINVASLRVATFEAAVQAAFNCGVTLRAGYNYTHEQTAGGGFSQYCPARPHTLSIRADWAHSFSRRWWMCVAVTGRVMSAVSYDSMTMYEPFTATRVTNPAYTLWKLQLTNRIYEGVTITLAADNIFNYAPTVYSYNAPVTLGTDFSATLTIEIDRFFK